MDGIGNELVTDFVGGGPVQIPFPRVAGSVLEPIVYAPREVIAGGIGGGRGVSKKEAAVALSRSSEDEGDLQRATPLGKEG